MKRTVKVDFLVLSDSPELAQTVRLVAGKQQVVHLAQTLEQADKIATFEAVGVLVTDIPVAQLAAASEQLELRAPGLVTIAARPREDAQALIKLADQGGIYRFLSEPLAAGQLRLSLEAAVRHHLDSQAAAVALADGPRIERHGDPKPSRGKTPLVAAAIAVVLGGATMAALNTPESSSAPTADAAATVSGPIVGATIAAIEASAKEASAIPLPETDAESIEALLAQAEQALDSQSLDEAGRLLTQVLRQAPGDPRLASVSTRLERAQQAALIDVALAAAEQDDYAAAENLLQQAADNRQGESQQLSQARLALAQRETAYRIEQAMYQAWQHFDAGELLEPPRRNAHYFLQLAREAGADPASLQALDDAIAVALANQAAQAMANEQLDQAEQLFDLASHVDPLPSRTVVESVAYDDSDTGTDAGAEMLAASAPTAPPEEERADDILPMQPDADALAHSAVDAVTGPLQAQYSPATNAPDDALPGEDSGWQAEDEAAYRAHQQLLAARYELEQNRQLYELVDTRIAEQRLLQPAGDNAQMYLQQLRQRNPQYPQLDLLSRRFGEALVSKALGALTSDRLQRARQLLDAANAHDASALGLQAAELAFAKTVQATQAEQEPAARTVARIPPRRTYVRPSYPRQAQRRGIQGRVELSFGITPEGDVDAIEIETAQPPNVFEQAAIDALKQWEFDAANDPGDQRYLVGIDFTLN